MEYNAVVKFNIKKRKNIRKFSVHRYRNNFKKERATYRVNYCPRKKVYGSEE